MGRTSLSEIKSAARSSVSTKKRTMNIVTAYARRRSRGKKNVSEEIEEGFSQTIDDTVLTPGTCTLFSDGFDYCQRRSVCLSFHLAFWTRAASFR